MSESVLVIVVVVIVFITVLCVAVSSQNKKKTAASESPVKPPPKTSEEPPKTDSTGSSSVTKSPAHRVITNITPAEPEPVPVKPAGPPSGEMEILLQYQDPKIKKWSCRYCGAEGAGDAARCQVCGQNKT